MADYTFASRKRADKGSRTVARARFTTGSSPESIPISSLRIPRSIPEGRRIDLPEAMRARMEHAFGADFSGVRFSENQAVADAGAEAAAQGNRVAFAPGRADFSSPAGQRLLGHELSHVVSQARGEAMGEGFLSSASLEARADREGAMAAAGEQVYSGPVTATLSDAAPSAAAMGPIQAKKASDEEIDRMANAYRTDVETRAALDAQPQNGAGNQEGQLQNVEGEHGQPLQNGEEGQGQPQQDGEGEQQQQQLPPAGMDLAESRRIGQIRTAAPSTAMNNISLGTNILKTGAGAYKDSMNYLNYTPPVPNAPVVPTNNIPGAVAGGLGIASGVLGTISGAKSTLKSYKNLDEGGSGLDVATGLMDTGSSLAGTVASTLSTAASLSKAIGDIPVLSGMASLGGSAWVPGLNIASGALTAISGFAQGRAAGKTRASLKERVRALRNIQNRNQDQNRMLQIFRQGKRNAKINQHFQYTKAASGAIRAAGGALSFLGGPAGIIASGLSSVAGFFTDIGGRVARHFKNKKMRDKVVADELGINWDTEIQRVKGLQGGGNLSDKEARRIILKGRGFNSGDQKEAFRQVTQKRAEDLIRIANGGDGIEEADRDNARAAIEEMGLKRRKNGGYNVGLLAAKLSKN
ncbi:MAG: DUF4157 domain-containing protein [Oscillospiraceae bacterium]|nr:DUF4157 domain-containing protein [Oscillospiraceae bacterium]